MIKWLLLIAVLTFGGYSAYQYFVAGYHTRPEIPDGAFSVSFPSGLRGIVVDLPEDMNRRYLGMPLEVPSYLEKTWSRCRPPSIEENPQVVQFMESRDLPGARFEAICEIELDGDLVTRGLLISVPRV
ncbi:MAG: hypothetical protein ACOH2N_06210 [Devosia sp.]